MSDRLSIIPEGHSPLGGSSMARAIACPGSVRLSYGLGDGEDDDTFSKPGTAAHALAERCLRTNQDAWEFIGSAIWPDGAVTWPVEPFISEQARAGGVLVDKEMADAVQVYLSHVRKHFPGRNQANSGVEEFINAPSIHPYFWMATDFWHCERHVLDVIDYKHGVGIVVEAENNVQLRYYACGVLEKRGLWDKVDDIRMTIVQPRGFHPKGPIRSWEIEVAELEDWLDGELVPAMDRALVSRDTIAGEHCRFCPAAGRQCPAILSATEELHEMIEKLKLGVEDAAPKLTPAQMSRFAELEDIYKIASKHVGRAIFGALQNGVKIEGRKLVAKQTHRAWKDGAEEHLVKALGKDAWRDRELRSPAEVEKLPGGDELAQRYAFKPEGGLTIASDRDMRRAVDKDMKSGFRPVKRGKK